MDLKKKYKKHYSGKFFPNVHLIIFRLFFSKFSSLNKNLNQKKILDIGCGLSGNFNFFSLLKMKVFGLEISNEIKKLILKKVGKKYNITIGTNSNIPFKSNFFDFIIGVHSIYYLEKNKTIHDNISEIKRVLNKNGILIFSLPKINSNHINFKKIDRYHFEVIDDKYNLRNKSVFWLFKTKIDIQNFFKKHFKTCTVGEMEYNIDNLSEKHFWIICKNKINDKKKTSL